MRHGMHQQRRAWAAVAAMLAAGSITGLGAAAAGASPAAKVPSCFGKPATIVVTGTDRHVVGTTGADVIVALGKGDSVAGRGGDDRICVGSAGTVDGGSGDDRISFVAGTIKGGDGADTLSQRGNGRATIDGGAGPDVLTVPKQDVNRDTIAPGAGDVLNNRAVRADAPVKAPDAYLTYGTDAFSAEGAPNAAGQVLATTSDRVTDQSQVLGINRVLAPVGRSIASWAVNFGDGSPVLRGAGDPPSQLPHAFVIDGAHPILVTLTDSDGSVARRTLVVSTAHHGSVSLAVSATAPGGPATFTPTYVVGAGSVPASWTYDFGDGAVSTGVGGPPAVTHTFGVGNWSPTLTVVDDHDGIASASLPFSNEPDTGPHPVVLLRTEVPLAFGAASPDTLSLPTTSVAVGQAVAVDLSASNNVSPMSIDFGDGRGPRPSTSAATTYGTPGPKSITVVFAGPSPAAPISVTNTLTVTPPLVHASLVAPTVATEGKVTVSTAGTLSPPGTLWYLQAGDDAPRYGVGAVPASITRSLAAGLTFAELTLQSPTGDVSVATTLVTVTGTQALAQALSAGDSAVGTLTSGTAYTRAGADATVFRGTAIPSAGHLITGGKLDFGDGTVVTNPTGIVSGALVPSETAHTYARPGVYRAVLTVTDDAHTTSSIALTVNAGGAPAVTPTAVPAPAGRPSVITLGGLTPGAGSTLVAYVVDYGDGTTVATDPTTEGYGAPPVSLAHAYRSPGNYTVNVFLRNDHGLTVSMPVPVVVSTA